ncbi:GNAT family N-acetyltransferase [Oceanobacillus oncorhynchi]|uniref:GNAT family N-acetyltransferase n=1 Tax=Oceanobacillus oncorhynchi TaxID=545501 RepID=UPI0021162CFA|nr:GNAT family N-acetyltransferase [Oceanobacillus oncorhynchi]UUI41588.1 GNAT family N-acetyltransferase [Oceanobacillus oncorhynchi]
MTITFKKVDSSNYKKCSLLKVNDNQKDFIAPNWYSVLEAVYEKEEKRTYAIYHEEEMVGFLMLCYYPASDIYDKDSWWMDRFMIAKDFQGKGYGKASLKKFMEDFQKNYPKEALRTSTVKENHVAITLYEHSGFQRTGEFVEEEAVLLMEE